MKNGFGILLLLSITSLCHANSDVNYSAKGMNAYKQGDYTKAIVHFKQDLKNKLVKFGPEHPDVATSYNQLGLAYRSKGQYDQAIGYYQKALTIQLKKLGAKHPYIAISYNNLGAAYYHKGQYDLAVENYQKALKIKLKNLGTEHPDTATSYNNLGLAYKSKGQMDNFGCELYSFRRNIVDSVANLFVLVAYFYIPVAILFIRRHQGAYIRVSFDIQLASQYEYGH